MNCTEFQNWLETAAERRVSARTASAASHASTCPHATCRTSWQQSLLLERALDGWRRISPPIDLTDRVVGDWRADARDGRPTIAGHVRLSRRSEGPTLLAVSNDRMRRRGRPLAAGWPAAAVGVVLCAAVMSLTVVRPAPDVTIAQRENSIPVESPAVADPGAAVSPESHGPMLQGMGRSYVGLVQNATHAVTDVVVLTFGGADSLEEPSPAVRWVDRWRDELGPVRSEVDDAWDEFFETFPDSLPST